MPEKERDDEENERLKEKSKLLQIAVRFDFRRGSSKPSLYNLRQSKTIIVPGESSDGKGTSGFTGHLGGVFRLFC